MKIVKPKARIAISAVYKQKVPVSLVQIMSKEVQIIGASNYTHEVFAKVVEHLNLKEAAISTIVTMYINLIISSKHLIQQSKLDQQLK